ncbi:AdipoR/hemolysin-III-related [Dillenia turbinata]|uniref:AdipoR/hemolysin-III-related n=1 Tax=Dillenia turbinata TaxID=194707 RepID=A0AAN8ZPB8_9MAGN
MAETTTTTATQNLVSDENSMVLHNKRGKNRKKRKNESQKKKTRYGLLSYHELPDHMKDNEFILNYYRVNWPLKHAFFSLFKWHNESLNAFNWICAVPGLNRGEFDASASSSGSIWQIHLGTTRLIDLRQMASQKMVSALPHVVAERWPFFVFLGGSMFCLLSSSICHLFCCHSHHLNILLLRMDYVGIAVMIITSFFPPIYYIFQCDPIWQIIYLSGITAMGVFTIITLLSPALSSGKFRTFRALLFLAMGLFGLIPAIHAMVVNWHEPRCPITLAYESAMALAYITGTMFYVSRIPERFKPGWFDLAGHSHQIFHVFVVIGALAHYCAALIFLEWRDHVGCK